MSDGKSRARRLRPEARRKQIIDVARALLVEQGYDAVTHRAVAARCEISLAGVQHFYPDKSGLVAAMIDGIGADYDAVYDRRAAEHGGGRASLENFERFIVLEDLAKAETAGFFFEMWRLAHREPLAAKAVSELYANQLDRMVALIHETNPALSDREAAARAAIIMGSHDGFMNTIGFGKARPPALKDVTDEDLVDLLVRLAASPPLWPA